MCSSVRGYHENRRSERHILLRRVSEFVSVVPTFMTLLGEIQYKISAHNDAKHLCR
jgi:hypothetical protein